MASLIIGTGYTHWKSYTNAAVNHVLCNGQVGFGSIIAARSEYHESVVAHVFV